jgi:hypothetical protein
MPLAHHRHKHDHHHGRHRRHPVDHGAREQRFDRIAGGRRIVLGADAVAVVHLPLGIGPVGRPTQRKFRQFSPFVRIWASLTKAW